MASSTVLRRISVRALIDTSVNIAILVTCMLIALLVLPRWMGSEPRQLGEAPLSAGQLAEAIPGIRYSGAPATLLLYVKSTCPYCTDAMPFFRELSGKAKQRNVPLVVVSPESLDIVQRYAAHHDLTAESIVSFQGKGVPTPTLVLVSPDGVMQTVWVGRQTPDGERRIFEALDAVS